MADDKDKLIIPGSKDVDSAIRETGEHEADTAGEYDLSPLDMPADEDDANEVTMAFAVYVTPEGAWIAAGISPIPGEGAYVSDGQGGTVRIRPTKDVNFGDMIAGTAVVNSDIQAIQTARRTVEAQVQMTAQIQQAQHVAAIQQKLANEGIHLPKGRG